MPGFVKRADTNEYDLYELNLGTGENGTFGIDIEKKYGQVKIVVEIAGQGKVTPSSFLAPASNLSVVANTPIGIGGLAPILAAVAPIELTGFAIGRLEFLVASNNDQVDILIRVQSRSA